VLNSGDDGEFVLFSQNSGFLYGVYAYASLTEIHQNGHFALATD